MIKLTHVQGTSQKTGKPYECLRLEIGDWQTLIFPKTRFEAKYIFDIVDKQNGAK